VRADVFSLEDVVTHILHNAQRHRSPGTPITLSLDEANGQALIGIHNLGPAIAPDRLERIFDYGVTDGGAHEAGAGAARACSWSAPTWPRWEAACARSTAATAFVSSSACPSNAERPHPGARRLR
jgi:hypothetical protein